MTQCSASKIHICKIILKEALKESGFFENLFFFYAYSLKLKWKVVLFFRRESLKCRN